jgi:hypothetical protein
MIRKSGIRFSEKIMLKQKLERDTDLSITHPALADDVDLHLRNALIDHSYPFSGRRRDIDRAPTNERTTVIDPDDDRASVSNISDAQSRAEWQCWMSGGQFIRIEFFTARSLRILPVEAGQRVRSALSSGRPRVRGEMPVEMGEGHGLLSIGSLQGRLIRYNGRLSARPEARRQDDNSKQSHGSRQIA